MVTPSAHYGDFVASGRLGQKSGGGFYDYGEDHNAMPAPAAARLIAEYARFRNVAPAKALGDQEILDRLLLPVVNEGAKLLEEGIALRASDILPKPHP